MTWLELADSLLAHLLVVREMRNLVLQRLYYHATIGVVLIWKEVWMGGSVV